VQDRQEDHQENMPVPWLPKVLLLDHNKISGPLTEVNNSSVPCRIVARSPRMGELKGRKALIDGLFIGTTP
jgi:hypothetical protein